MPESKLNETSVTEEAINSPEDTELSSVDHNEVELDTTSEAPKKRGRKSKTATESVAPEENTQPTVETTEDKTSEDKPSEDEPAKDTADENLSDHVETTQHTEIVSDEAVVKVIDLKGTAKLYPCKRVSAKPIIVWGAVSVLRDEGDWLFVRGNQKGKGFVKGYLHLASSIRRFH